MIKMPIKFVLVALMTGAVMMVTNANADAIKIESNYNVDQSVMRLKGAVEKAGARIFTEINYTEGVASMGESIRPTTVVLFGSPKIGASAFQAGQTIGLYLPLRVLAYEDAAGKTWLMYNDPSDAAQAHGIAPDHPAIKKMQGALKKITSVASGS